MNMLLGMFLMCSLTVLTIEAKMQIQVSTPCAVLS